MGVVSISTVGSTTLLKSDGTGNVRFLRSAKGLANGVRGANKGSIKSLSRTSFTPMLKNLF